MKSAVACSRAASTASEEKEFERRRRKSDRRGNAGFSLRNVQLPNGVHGPGPPADAPDSGHPRSVPRHRLSLPRDIRIPRSHGGTIRPESDQSQTPHDGRGTGGPLRNSISKRAGPLLRYAQSRAAVRRSRTLRRLVHGPTSRSIADTSEPAREGRIPAAQRQDS